MKRFLLAIGLFFCALTTNAQIKTITGGGFQKPDGTACVGCVLFLQLSSDATVSGTGQIIHGTPKSYTLDASGNVPANSTIWGNDQFTATGTYYAAALTFPGGGGTIWGPIAWSLVGNSPINLSQVIAVNPSPIGIPNPALLAANNAFTGTNTFSGTTTLNGSTQYGINLAYPAFSNTPPNGSTAVRQFDQFCAPDTDGLRGCGWVLNKFANNGNDLTNFFMQAPWNPGLNIYNAGLSSAITSISRVTGTGVVTVNTSSQVSLRPTNGDVVIAGVTGCATPPNGHFFPATVVSATQFTFIQAGPTESCTPSTGTASPPVRAQHFFTHNDTSNVQQQIWLWENDVLGDRSDQFGLLQLPAAGGTGNVGSFGRLVFSSAPCTTVGCGVNTGEQGSSSGNFTYYGLLRANSINSDALNSVASFSLRNFASTRETFIHGGGSNGNGTWDVIFNSQRGLSSNGIIRFSLAGDGIIYSSASDGGALIPLQPFAGVIIPTGRAVNLTEGTATASAGTDTIWGDSVAHRVKMNNNNTGADVVVGAATTDTLTNKTISNARVGLGALGAIQDSTGATSMGLTLKKGSGAGNYTNATTTYTVADSTNLCFTVTIPTGWKLGISASGALQTATAAAPAQAALTDNAACSTANAGILVETGSIQGAGISIADAFALNWVVTGDGAAHNIALQFKTSNAADTASLINSSATITPTIKFELMPSN